MQQRSQTQLCSQTQLLRNYATTFSNATIFLNATITQLCNVLITQVCNNVLQRTYVLKRNYYDNVLKHNYHARSHYATMQQPDGCCARGAGNASP